MNSVQVKICGITDAAQARSCAAAGADALGFVFYAGSPRNVSPAAVAEITRSLPPKVAPVGVFVDRTGDEIAKIALAAGLRTVQLHGPSMPDTAPLKRAGLRIVRVLFDIAPPELPPEIDAVLIECGRGAMPGGNALQWDYAGAASLVRSLPLPAAIAGGLAARNVGEALDATHAAAADTSSGVESAPGVKDLSAVEEFIAVVRKRRYSTEDKVF